MSKTFARFMVNLVIRFTWLFSFLCFFCFLSFLTAFYFRSNAHCFEDFFQAMWPRARPTKSRDLKHLEQRFPSGGSHALGIEGVLSFYSEWQ